MVDEWLTSSHHWTGGPTSTIGICVQNPFQSSAAGLVIQIGNIPVGFLQPG